jgi:hypothetical protein
VPITVIGSSRTGSAAASDDGLYARPQWSASCRTMPGGDLLLRPLLAVIEHIDDGFLRPSMPPFDVGLWTNTSVGLLCGRALLIGAVLATNTFRLTVKLCFVLYMPGRYT